MTTTARTLKAPFPYFGGKSRAAKLVWDALGDPGGYIEPFAGSAAVLLRRPEFIGRRVETINDADGWLANAWRAIQLSPNDVARHAAGPVSEIDYHARLAWLNERRSPELISWLEGDPEAHDAKAAGWWLYVMACGIGDPWGGGPWRVLDGHLVDTRALPHLGNAGQGVNRKLPHLGDAGQGVNRKLPHLGNAGRGVNRELPHLGNAGQEARLCHYFAYLSARLERVRITCGDWKRVVTPTVLRVKSGGDGSVGVFMDPPYSVGSDVYAESSAGIADQVRKWCAEQSPSLKIVLCGYDNEHDDLLKRGWTVIHGKAGGGAGYSTNAMNGRRERLWLSPACIQRQRRLLV